LFNQREKKDKTSFWATDFGKNAFDIYHSWIGTEPTNPFKPETLIMFEVAKKLEMAWVENMAEAGLLKPQKEQLHFFMEREDVPVTGMLDGITKDGYPIEIKSFYGYYQEKSLIAQNPKSSYCGQLAVYMDYLDVDKGYLLHICRGTGKIYLFEQTRKGDEFTCGNTKINLLSEYQRWSKIYKDFIMKTKEPPSDYQYKYPLDEINYTKQTKAAISRAKRNESVLGDWQVKYSAYKDLIIEREGCGTGYSAKELETLQQLTKDL
jgi:hypothetical protein